MSDASIEEVRFWNFPRHFRAIEDEVMAEIVSTLRAGDLVMRQQLRNFEEAFGARIGTQFCVGVSNCTDGLRLTLEALGIGQGDEVITVSHTFVATLAAIHHVGATPVLADVGRDHLMDVGSVEGLLTENTRAIIPVHLNGRVCDMERLMPLADAHGVVVVEDAAQAVGAKVDGRTAGTFGAAACYSFYPAKLLGAFGDAGAVVTNDPILANRLILLRDHGRRNKTELAGWGWNCRLDNVQASILLVKLGHLDEWIARRREIAITYDQGLGELAEVLTPPLCTEPETSFDVYQNYVIETDDRDGLQAHLAGEGIETMVSWPKPVHKQRGLGLDHHELPATEALCDRVLSLPIYPEMIDSEVERVVTAIRQFCSG
jgi:dTDP-4-amino-4,6-dideoxygalactose transaminase